MEGNRRGYVRDVGKAAVTQAKGSVRGRLRNGLADLLRNDPEVLSSAIELGLVRREWVDDP
ncbi:MAG TPA: hypothetical protein VI916_04065, partial [Acidimicrobiia bacterium]|nr:hypothetical protein [Acidimicrobiia bacterium]